MKPIKQQLLVGLLLALVVFILVLQATSKPPISWLESYDKMDKSPYGGRVFYEQFTQTVGSKKVKEINISTYEWLRNEPVEGVLLIFNSSFYPDKETSKKLLDWVEEGNTAFISARFIGQGLLDSLGIKIQSVVELNNHEESSHLFISDNSLIEGKDFLFERMAPLTYFMYPDSLPIQLLGSNGYFGSAQEPQPNFIKMSYGEGSFILHLFPLAFTNYFLLEGDNKIYTEAILSYLAVEKYQTVYYDNYIKNGKSVFASPLYLFLSNPNLKWAYYSIILMLILWIIFEGRRKQRSIPVVKPLANQTVSFAETIAAMYLEKRAYKENVHQQIALHLEYCRTTFRLPTILLDEESILKIAARSGYPIEKTRNLFVYMDVLQKKQNYSQEDVMELNKKIMDFKAYQDGRK